MYEFCLRLSHGFVNPLDLVQLSVLVPVHHLLVIWRVLCSVQNQGPLEKRPGIHGIVLARGHRYLQLPQTTWVLRPGVGGHEGPAGEAVLVIVVIGSLTQDHSSEQKK